MLINVPPLSSPHQKPSFAGIQRGTGGQRKSWRPGAHGQSIPIRSPSPEKYCQICEVKVESFVWNPTFILVMMVSQGESGTRGSSGKPGLFGQRGTTGTAGAKGQKGLHGHTVRDIQ